MARFRDPTLLIQFIGAVLAVVVSFNVGLSDEQAALWMAVIADTGTSLIVVANAMRLLRHA